MADQNAPPPDDQSGTQPAQGKLGQRPRVRQQKQQGDKP